MMQTLKRKPRRESNIKIHYHNKDIFKAYCKETGNPCNLTQQRFFNIFNEYIEFINDRIVTEGSVFNMPLRTGRIGVFKTKIVYKLKDNGEVDKKGFRVDWNNTVKLWEDIYSGYTMSEIKDIKDKPLIFFMNKNTDGYNLRFLWDKSSSNTINQFLYRFKPVRNLSRKLASHIKDGTYKNDYPVNMYRIKSV